MIKRLYALALSALIAFWPIAALADFSGPNFAKQLITVGSPTTTATNTTQYYLPGGVGTSTNNNGFVAAAGIFSLLSCSVATSPGVAATDTCTLYTGATQGSLSASALTCTISGISQKLCSDSADSVTVAAGTLWAFVITTSTTATATGSVALGAQFVSQ